MPPDLTVGRHVYDLHRQIQRESVHQCAVQPQGTRFDRGLKVESRALGLDSALVDRLTLDLPMRVVKVATDGEIRRQQTPLEYRLARGALNLVVPS